MIDIGSKLGDYWIVARLRAGGMATLFLGRRHGAAGFSKHVAIKVVHPHLASDPGFVRMFVDEAKLSAQIQHPNVVHVEELGEDQGTYFLVMEYVHGCALSQLMGALAQLERRMAPELAAWIAMRVAEGLHAAHEARSDDGRPLGVVHRDVSPQNVLLSLSGNVKLIDFGVAKARGRSQKTATGSLKGKLRYMPPEQAYGRNIDRRADIYALGVVLWEMLTLQRLFKGDNDLALIDEVRNPKIIPPSRLAPGISAALDQVVMTALSPDASKRYATALDFTRALAHAVPGAAGVDTTKVSEVIDAVLGDELDRRRRSLPESVSGVQFERPTLAGRTEATAEDVLQHHTISAPGVDYEPDLWLEADPDVDPAMVKSTSRSARDVALGSRGGTPVPVEAGASSTPVPASAARRYLTLGAGATVLAVVVAATTVALVKRDEGAAVPPTELAAPPPRAVEPAPVAAAPIPEPSPSPLAAAPSVGAPEPEPAVDSPSPVRARPERGSSTSMRRRPHATMTPAMVEEPAPMEEVVTMMEEVVAMSLNTRVPVYDDPDF